MSGYSLRSLVLAFLVVNRQLMGAVAALRCDTQNGKGVRKAFLK